MFLHITHTCTHCIRIIEVFGNDEYESDDFYESLTNVVTWHHDRCLCQG